MNENVVPGLHPFAKENLIKFFSEDEIKIAEYFAGQWYVTKADRIFIGSSQYKYILIKPTYSYEEQFNLTSELIAVFSDYAEFEPRTIDTFDNIKSRLELGRVENLCGILISKYENIDYAIKKHLAEQETRIIVPFSYSSILKNKGDNFLIRNKLRQFFYSRDLFDFTNPLKTDMYFFGRNQVVMDIINKHTNNQNSGLFGLRRTGKTSIIYDVKRKLEFKNAIGVFIDCQSPSITNRRWYQVLYYILLLVIKEFNINDHKLDEKEFDEISATDLFEYHFQTISKDNNMTILLLFDEIENITFGKSPNDNWCKGLDFIYLWQAIRSVYQKEQSCFSFCIFGTNPNCVELPTILGKDNPIFNMFTPTYIPGFDTSQTREMVRKLGRIMGIKFDETIYSKLTEDYGGHPFLIRHLCSLISNLYPDRPVTIDRIKYNKAKDEFNKNKTDYFEMLIEVLKQFYNDEYEMLECLAKGDIETFRFFASADYSYVKHLIGYGIVKELDGYYDFKIDAIKDYILSKSLSKKLYKNNEEKWSHICTARCNLEIELRKMVKEILVIVHKGKSSAKEYVVKKIFGRDERNYINLSYDELFDPKKSKIYLSNLTTLIKLDWDFFSTFTGDVSQEDFLYIMAILNKEGRFEAHAKIPTDDDMVLIDSAINKINNIINNFRS